MRLPGGLLLALTVFVVAPELAAAAPPAPRQQTAGAPRTTGATPLSVAAPPATTPASRAPSAPIEKSRTPEKKRSRIAVLEVKALQGVSEASAAVITELVATEIANLRRYDVVSRADIQTMLGFQLQKKMLGCAEDTACMAEIGGALGADYLLSGQVSEFGQRYRLALTLQDVKKGKVVARLGTFCDRNEDALAIATQQAVKNVFRELESGGDLPPAPIAIAKPDVASAPAPGPSRRGVAAIVVGSVGIAGVLAGGTFDYLGYRAHQREKSSAAAGDVSGYDQARADVSSHASKAKIFYAGGALLAGAGLILYLTDSPRSAAHLAVDVRPLPGGGLALVSGSLP